MPPGALFTRLGLFVRPAFLDDGACADARATAAAAEQEAALVVRGADDDTLYTDSRRSSVARVDAEALARARDRFLSVMPELARHFGVPLSGCETPKFLVYRAGDYFRPHHDSSPREDAPVNIRLRKVSAVVFLNAASSTGSTPSFTGGGLVFYGLLSGAAGTGLEMAPEAGTLVAFRSDTMHEVTPIEAGERYTLVTWYH